MKAMNGDWMCADGSCIHYDYTILNGRSAKCTNCYAMLFCWCNTNTVHWSFSCDNVTVVLLPRKAQLAISIIQYLRGAGDNIANTAICKSGVKLWCYYTFKLLVIIISTCRFWLRGFHILIELKLDVVLVWFM